MAYIYRHIRLDKNEPFYIGIGDNSHEGTYPRAHSKKPKNKIECPHCGIMSQPALAHRWHFDNCKKK